MMRRALIISSLLIFCTLLAAPVAMAQEESKKKKVDAIPIEYQVNIPGLGDEAQIVYGPTGGCPVDHVCVRTISSYINAFYKWSASAAIIMAIIIIMIGGIEYMIGSAVGTIEKAKDHIKNGVIGLLLVFSTSAVLSFVNPNITQISAMELPAIETVFVTSENTDQDNADPDPGNPGQVGLPPVTTSSNPQKLALQPSGSNVTVPSARPAKQVPVNEVVTAPTVPYYNQRSYSDVYGGCGTIKSSGCGPTSAAMVLSYLEVNADPPKVASAFAADGFRACPKDDEGKPICDKCNGTNWGAFTSSSIVTDNNLVGRQIQAINRKEILSLLSAGKPLIASMGCSRFTRYGHFVVLTGMNADGTIAVNDPNSTSRNQTTASELWEEVYVTADGKRDCTQRGNRAALKSVWLIESKDATSRNTELDEEDIWPNDHLQLASSFLLDSVKNFVPKPL